MVRFNSGGNNAAGYRSDGGLGDDLVLGAGYSNGGGDRVLGAGVPTRDFLSQLTLAAQGGYNAFTAGSCGMPVPSSLNPSRLDLDGLDLNLPGAEDDDRALGAGVPIRDFLSQPALAAQGGYNAFTAGSCGMPVPSSLNPSLLDLDGLDLSLSLSLSLSLTQSWSGMQDPPPVRVPSRGVKRALGLRGAELGGSASVGADPFPPPMPPHAAAATVRRRRRGAAACGSGTLGEKDRATWTPEHTKTFCQIYCSQIENGNCVGGVMSKAGWREVAERFCADTGLVHDNEQFGNKLRNLVILWQFIRKLQKKASGILGRRPDGSVVATDIWWEKKTQGKSHCKCLKNGWPAYMGELERMLEGVAVDGFTSFAPGTD
ncbi:hypothetical protein ACP4OV_004767 [Aristida adscensionis]